MGYRTIPVDILILRLDTHRYSNAGKVKLQSRFGRTIPKGCGRYAAVPALFVGRASPLATLVVHLRTTSLTILRLPKVVRGRTTYEEHVIATVFRPHVFRNALL